jgi:hypothetical protein
LSDIINRELPELLGRALIHKEVCPDVGLLPHNSIKRDISETGVLGEPPVLVQHQMPHILGIVDVSKAWVDVLDCTIWEQGWEGPTKESMALAEFGEWCTTHTGHAHIRRTTRLPANSPPSTSLLKLSLNYIELRIVGMKIRVSTAFAFSLIVFLVVWVNGVSINRNFGVKLLCNKRIFNVGINRQRFKFLVVDSDVLVRWIIAPEIQQPILDNRSTYLITGRRTW